MWLKRSGGMSQCQWGNGAVGIWHGQHTMAAAQRSWVYVREAGIAIHALTWP